MRSDPIIVQSVGEWLPLSMPWLYEQLQALDRFSPVVIAVTTNNAGSFPGTDLHYPRNPTRRLAIRALRKLGVRCSPREHHEAIARVQPALLHSHFGHIGWHDLPLRRRYGFKHVVTFYGVDVNGLPTRDHRWLGRYRELFAESDAFLVEGEHMAECLARLGCPRGKIALQRIGVRLERLAFKARRLPSNGAVRCLVTARFVEKKGVPCALRALAIARKSFPELRVTLVGDALAGDRLEKKKIERTLIETGLSCATERMGFIAPERLTELAYEHHLFVSPSQTAADGDTEGGAPVAILEMAATGMPVLSTRHCDIPNVVEHGKTGLLCAERDAEGLAANIEWMIRNPEKASAMGRAGHERVSRDHDIKAASRSLQAIYDRLLAGAGSSPL